MRESRFFVPQALHLDELATLDGRDRHHAIHVLRLKKGDLIRLHDRSGSIWRARIESENGSDSCVYRVLEPLLPAHKMAEAKVCEVHLWQCLPKGSKLDEIIQKSVELGVGQIHPLLSERSVSRPDAQSANKKLRRWQAIAEAAAKQSGRLQIPEVQALCDFDAGLQAYFAPKSVQDFSGNGNHTLAIMPWEQERGQSLRQLLAPYLLSACRSGEESGESCLTQNDDAVSGASAMIPQDIHVLIGAEGGISETEAEYACSLGFSSVTLGQTILRCETAGPAVLAMLNLALPGRM